MFTCVLIMCQKDAIVQNVTVWVANSVNLLDDKDI